MADDTKLKGQGEQVKGRVQKAVGDLTGDKEAQDKGQAAQNRGNVKEGVGSVKDKLDDVKDSVTGSSRSREL